VLAAVKDAARRLCGGREERPSLTATAHGGSERLQVGTEGWPRSNKRIGTKHFPERNTAPSLQSPCRHIHAGRHEVRCPLCFFVQRLSDDLVHWFRSVYFGNVSDAAAILAASAESGYFPVMMRAGVRAVFAEWHAHIIANHSVKVPSKYFSGTISSRYLKHGQQTTSPISFGSLQARQIVSVRTCASRFSIIDYF
jgi:hypothetical protein